MQSNTKPKTLAAAQELLDADVEIIRELNDEIKKLSDGYHTFEELYEHRCLLYIGLITKSSLVYDGYFIREHYEGWDLLVAELDPIAGRDSFNGEVFDPQQISYHVPARMRPLYEHILDERQSEEHDWDGHTSSDVVKRLYHWLAR